MCIQIAQVLSMAKSTHNADCIFALKCNPYTLSEKSASLSITFKYVGSFAVSKQAR